MLLEKEILEDATLAWLQVLRTQLTGAPNHR